MEKKIFSLQHFVQQRKLNNSIKIMKRKISFKRDGLTIVGNLFTPENFDENGHYKAIICRRFRDIS